MEQLDKVRKGLECCVLRDPDDHRRCGECPYNHHAISNEPCANGLMFNALALINAQQERINELEAGKKWISVKDRVPDEMTCEYLVVNNGAVGLAIYHDGLWISPSRSVNITHWMPLPEPPKEEERESMERNRP